MLCETWRRAAAYCFGIVVAAGVSAGQEPDADEGRLVQIGPDKSVERAEQPRPRRLLRDRGRRLVQPGFAEAAPGRGGLDGGAAVAVGRYWIGLGGVTTPDEVRAHVDTGDSPGILVREVVPDGPAAQAGVKPMDILTRANNELLTTLDDLAEVVGDAGQNKARIALELLRKGRPKTVFVAPEWKEIAQPVAPRPMADPGIAARGRLRQWLGDRLAQEGILGPGGVDQLLNQQLGQLEQEFGGAFGGGAPGGGEAPAFIPQAMPTGVTVNITRAGDGPAQVVVRRANPRGEADEWRFDSDDEQAIARLPDDVRPTVERMLGGANAFGGGGFAPGPGDQDVQQRLQLMEEQLNRFRQRFQNGGGFGAAGDDPLGGAPRLFGAPDDAEVIAPSEDSAEAAEEGPTELVLPAE
ncbi:MAG: PDZ domain-containing protein [Planctomycetota bacterium]